MTYREMVKFLNDNDIKVIQPVIASEVENQLEVDIPDDEFEEICESVFDRYLSSFREPDIWELVDQELKLREYKE